MYFSCYIFCYRTKNDLFISITKNIVDGDLALPWSKIDVHVVSFTVSSYLYILVLGLGCQLVPEVQGLLGVVRLGLATLETLAAGGDQDRDGVRVAVRAEDSHRH